MGFSKYEIFLKAAEVGNITQTAELMHYTQAGVSHAVNAVEREAGVRLFARSASGISLTANGEKLLPEIRALVKDTQRLRQVMQEMKGVVAGTLRVGTFTSVSTMWLPSIIRGFQERYPQVTFEPVAGDAFQLTDWILSGKIDCSFLDWPVHESLWFTPLYQDPMIVLLPKDHPLLARKAVSAEDLENEPFIIPLAGSDTEIRQVMKTFRRQPPIRYAMNDDLSVMAMVTSGFGVTIMPEMLLRHARFDFNARPMDPPAFREIGIASLPKDRVTLLTIRFIEYMKGLSASGDLEKM